MRLLSVTEGIRAIILSIALRYFNPFLGRFAEPEEEHDEEEMFRPRCPGHQDDADWRLRQRSGIRHRAKVRNEFD